MLKRGETASLSFIILDAPNKNVMVRSWRVDGKCESKIKNPLELTFYSGNNNDNVIISVKYLQIILNGKVHFDDLNIDNSYFRGFIKI